MKKVAFVMFLIAFPMATDAHQEKNKNDQSVTVLLEKYENIWASIKSVTNELERKKLWESKYAGKNIALHGKIAGIVHLQEAGKPDSWLLAIDYISGDIVIGKGKSFESDKSFAESIKIGDVFVFAVPLAATLSTTQSTLDFDKSVFLSKDRITRVEKMSEKAEKVSEPKKPPASDDAPKREFVSLKTLEDTIKFCMDREKTSAQQEERWKEIAGKYIRMKATVEDVRKGDGDYVVDWKSVDKVIHGYRYGRYGNDKRNMEGSVFVNKERGIKLSKNDSVNVVILIGDNIGEIEREGEIE